MKSEQLHKTTAAYDPGFLLSLHLVSEPGLFPVGSVSSSSSLGTVQPLLLSNISPGPNTSKVIMEESSVVCPYGVMGNEHFCHSVSSVS